MNSKRHPRSGGTVLTGPNIAKAIIEGVKPRRIAVAYLGVDWERFLPNHEEIEAIVISPQLGTNPEAVEDLAKKLTTNGRDGWDRIFLHETLHAKIYLGQTSAVLGSANLSFNGLGHPERREICYETSTRSDLEALEEFFQSVKSEAQKQFGSTKEKLDRLETLRADIERNPSVEKPGRPARHLKDIEWSDLEEAYVCWYDPKYEITHSEVGKNWEKGIYREITFAKTDKIDAGKWILCWELDSSNGKPAPANESNYYWMKVDHVLLDGAEDDVYTQLAIMLKGKNKGSKKARCAQAPFLLDSETVEAFRGAIEDENLGLAEFFVQPSLDFNLKKSRKGWRKLIKAMKDRLDPGPTW